MQFMLLSEQYRSAGLFYEVRFLSIIARVLSDSSRSSSKIKNGINTGEKTGREA